MLHTQQSHFHNFCVTELAVAEGYHAEEYEIYRVVTKTHNHAAVVEMSFYATYTIKH